MRHRRLADGADVEAHVEERAVVEAVAAVEEERRLAHERVDVRPVERRELPPVREDRDGVRALDRLVLCYYVDRAYIL